MLIPVQASLSIFYILFIWLPLEATGSRRLGVYITGTTLGNHFVRKEGRLSYLCPEEYPFSFDGGKKCCKYYNMKNQVDCGGNGGVIDFYSPEQCCRNDEYLSCPVHKYPCRGRIFGEATNKLYLLMGPVCHYASHMRTQDTLSCPE